MSDDELDEYREQEPDPQLDPARSPGMHTDIEALEDIEVSRADVTIGEATPEELAAADTEPVADSGTAELLADLDDGVATERRRAALALKDADSEAVVPALARAATGDEDADVRQFAVEALTTFGSERAAAVAVELLDDPDPWVRAEAVVALDNIDRAAHEEAIADTLDSDDHHAVRRNAAISLFKLRGEAMADELLEMSRADSERLREWAAHMLAGVSEASARDRLRELTDDPATVVRQTAEKGLEADPDRFRRQFGGALEHDSRLLPGEDRLNRMPDL